ncbi:hypothetical protein BC829DRAFT_413781 [Chytridium lagenaria]|nr:hypothetical protein BC829DRAFT_413781 [Chytridium lagenaria]
MNNWWVNTDERAWHQYCQQPSIINGNETLTTAVPTAPPTFYQSQLLDIFADHGLYTTAISTPPLTASPVSEQSICVEPTNNYSFERAEWDEYGGPLCTDNYCEKRRDGETIDRFDPTVATVYPSPPSTSGKHHCVERPTRDSVECAKCIADLKGEATQRGDDQNDLHRPLPRTVPAYMNINVENVCRACYQPLTPPSPTYQDQYVGLPTRDSPQWAEFFADLKAQGIYFDLDEDLQQQRDEEMIKMTSTDLTSAKAPTYMNIDVENGCTGRINEANADILSSWPTTLSVKKSTKTSTATRPAVTALRAASNSRQERPRQLQLQKKTLFKQRRLRVLLPPPPFPQTKAPKEFPQVTPNPLHRTHRFIQHKRQHIRSSPTSDAQPSQILSAPNPLTSTLTPTPSPVTPQHKTLRHDNTKYTWLTGIDIVAKYSSFPKGRVGETAKNAVKSVKGGKVSKKK